jgi:uncharacterized repeat protein (TIGR01451 family)
VLFGNATIRRTTISGNKAFVGGGVLLYSGQATFENVTIAGNAAITPLAPPPGPAAGGGVGSIASGSTSTFNESTITGNTALSGGGGIDMGSSSDVVTLLNSIVANNTAAAGTTPDINSGGTVTATYTLIETPGTATIGGGTGNITGVDPQLGPLADNRSPVVAGAPGSTSTPQTELQACTSPVVDAGDPAFVPPPATDQRGVPRVGGGRIDMGAVEFQPSSVQFSATTQSVSEGGGSATVSAVRTGSDGPVTVNFATANGTAQETAIPGVPGTPDYAPQSGVLTWADGNSANQQILIPIADDNVFEGNENFTATLSSPTCTSIGPNATQTMTVVDNETQPTLAIGSISQNEGDSGTTLFNVPVTLSGPSAQPITVNFATADGTAAAGSDYTATSGTLTFAPGVTTQTISVPILGDMLHEANETFTVDLSAPVNATITPGAGTGTIQNDDGAPALSIDSVAQPEGNSGTTPMSFTVTLAPGSGQTVTVDYTTADGTAAAGSDYTATSGTLTFNPGVTTQTISVPILGDMLHEANETFTVDLSAPVNATITPGAGTGTIQNDDLGHADLTITKTTTGSAFFAAQTITYNIVVSNAGPDPTGEIVVTDVLPAGASFVSATPSQGSCSGTTTVTCTLGTLANGGSANITLNVTPAAAGSLSNTAIISATPQPDPNPANNASTANVTVSPASAIPALGDWAKIFLALSCGLIGLFTIKKT